MEKLVTTFFTEEQFKVATTGVSDLLELITPYSTSLNDDERLGIRGMGEGREGYARLVSRVANTHLECLPRVEEPAKTEAALDYFSALAALREKVGKLYEMLDDTTLAVSADIMATIDRYGMYLQAARKGNTSLDISMDQIDAFNKKFGPKSKQDETPDTEEPKA